MENRSIVFYFEILKKKIFKIANQTMLAHILN